MGFMQDKRVLIVGVASNRSIAWGIAEAMKAQGAEIAFTYQNEKLKERVEKLAAECGSSIVLPCDVSNDAEIDQVFVDLGKHWDGLDCIVHSVAFAPAKPWKAPTSTRSPARTSASPTTSAPTASPPWPRPAGR